MRAVRALMLVVPAAAVTMLVGLSPASAASCAAVKVTGGLNAIALSPSAVTIKVGGCVRFTNSTTAPPPFDTVSITVGSVTRSGVGQGSSTTFTESKAGRFAVTARQSGTSATATGRVTVTAPSPSPTPKPTPSPTATHPSSPTPSAAPLPSQSTGPQVAPTRSTPARSPSFPPSPSSSSGSFLVGTTTPSPTPSATILTGPLQPASGRGVGLPAALAALFAIGSGGGLLRVLLAVPVPPRR